ncbi:MAG: transporter substrate-binding domain-containing protein, partial [Oscillospiraceae bacterium]
PEAEGVRTLRIGVGNTFRPYAYIDRDGLPTGFEPALLREIDRRIPEVQFVYEPLDMTGLILGLEGGRLDIIVYQLGKNAEREQKFWFGGESYLKTGVQVTVAADSGITGLRTCAAKPSMKPPSSNVVVDAFNAENPISRSHVHRDGAADRCCWWRRAR